MSNIKSIWRVYIWEDIKENRDGYFVRYLPLNLKDNYFATLELVFTFVPSELETVAKKMEVELDLWINRFPLPIMIWAMDEKGDKISLTDIRANSELFGYLDKQENKTIKSWERVRKEMIPLEQLSDEYINKVYRGLSFKTRDELEQEKEAKIKEKRKIKKFLDFTLICWLGVLAIISYLGWQSYWVGALAFIYSLYKIIRRVIRLKGIRTKKEKEEAETKRKMRHYYYHCERNPIGFQRLRAKNIEEDEKKKIKEEQNE